MLPRKLLKILLGILIVSPVASGQALEAVKPSKFSRIVHAVANHVTLGVATGASSGFATAGTFYCREHNPDVEGCTEHYGSARGGEIARGVFTGGMIALSEFGRKQHFKEWFVPELGTLGFNLFWGARQFRTHEVPHGQ